MHGIAVAGVPGSGKASEHDDTDSECFHREFSCG
jgi:hypothetical protein